MKTRDKIQKEAIINILNDYILWFRVENAMFVMMNVYAPKKKMGIDWEADCRYCGFQTCLLLLNIDSNDDLCHKICDRTSDMVYENETEAIELAKLIYLEWLLIIKNHFTVKEVA